ncbi:MAG: hypothetical protein WBO97_02395 [Tepidiformaceae bacterium]
MDRELIFIVKEEPEGGYSARAVGEAIATEADDLASLREKIREAVAGHFTEDESPEVIRMHVVRH